MRSKIPKMKIVNYTHEKIEFDDGSYLCHEHDQVCCEDNYADFEQIEKSALNHDFDKETFRLISNEYGFRFGDKNRTFFIPCYSEQNGCYGTDVSIFYRDRDDKNVLTLNTDCYEVLPGDEKVILTEKGNEYD